MRKFLLNNKETYTTKDFITEIVLEVVALLLIIFLFFTSTFWISTVRVKQTSMTNTLYDGDILVLDKLASVEAGDIIVFKQNENEDYIKRVIAVEGDVVYSIDGEVYVDRVVNGELKTINLVENYIKNAAEGTYLSYYDKVDIPKLTVGKGQYFVLGDNRENSTDSRTYFNSDGTINLKTNDLKYVGLVKESQIIGVVHEFWVKHKDITSKIFAKK